MHGMSITPLSHMNSLLRHATLLIVTARLRPQVWLLRCRQAHAARSMAMISASQGADQRRLGVPLPGRLSSNCLQQTTV
jgi:hypothetical protein